MRSGKVNGVAGSLRALFLLWGRRETAVFAGPGDVRGCQPLLCHEPLSGLPTDPCTERVTFIWRVIKYTLNNARPLMAKIVKHLGIFYAFS